MFGNANPHPYQPPRPLGQDYRRSATNEMAKALPLVYGRQRVGCEFISDVFDILTGPVYSGGKQSSREGTNYYASFVVAVCHGPVSKLHDLYLNGDPVFTNNTPIYETRLTITANVATFTTANPHGLTTGQTVVIYNCQQVEFNGEFLITVMDATHFTYNIPGGTITTDTATPVEGTSIYALVKLDPIAAAGDSTEFTIPDFGTATIYWGTQTQAPDAYTAAASGVQHPPYRGVCYIVFRQLYLGFNQTSVQNVEVVIERTPSFPGQSNPAHANINGNCNPACIAADLLLSPVYGLACDLNVDFNAGSFDAAAEQFYSDGIGFSPNLNRPEELQSQIADMLAMVDAMPALDMDGKFAIALQRQGTIGATTVQDSDMVELPQFAPDDWSNVVNQTTLNYLDRDAGWQPDFVNWLDTAGIYAKDRPDPQSLDKQFVTDRVTAQTLCDRAGQLAALPKQNGKLVVAFSLALWAALTPGEGFTFNSVLWPRYNGIYRVQTRTMPDPAKPVFEIEVVTDRSYLYAN